jgi:tRNA threonylcarbamoyladenosine modification (KEOPS) complex Cgi121 subunit
MNLVALDRSVLRMHERTVKLHRTSNTRKLGVHSAAHLALLAQESGRRLARNVFRNILENDGQPGHTQGRTP